MFRFRLLSLQLLALSSTIHNAADAWVPQQARLATHHSSGRTTSLFMSDSQDDEIEKLEAELKIARLEAELAKLKEEKEDSEAPVAAVETPPPPPKPVGVIEKEPPKPVVEDEEEEMLEEASMDMFLSEGWKEARSGYDPKKTATATRQAEEQGNALGLLTKVVGGILAVVLFSQIPVGQEDLSKYSSIKSAPAKVSIDLGDTNRVKGQILNYGDDYAADADSNESSDN
jgi:hypothetical protein